MSAATMTEAETVDAVVAPCAVSALPLRPPARSPEEQRRVTLAGARACLAAMGQPVKGAPCPRCGAVGGKSGESQTS